MDSGNHFVGVSAIRPGALPLEGLTRGDLNRSHAFGPVAPQQFACRLLSVSVAIIGIVVCLPFVPFLMLAVFLSSPGPVFFRQTRVGLLGRPFSVLKFRTMRQDAETAGAVWASHNDSRVTPLGKWMRSMHLDEIPQLWNVLRGDMSVVGPRPERPEFVAWLASEIPCYHLRHLIRPGITGWAQVRYHYAASLEESRCKLQYDLYYVKHRSIRLDLRILFETVRIVLLGTSPS